MCHTCETNKGFDDLEGDLDAAVAVEPKTFLEAQVDYAANGAEKTCPRCKGSGEWVGGYVNHTVRPCAICKGSGKVKAGYKYKTPAEYASWKAKKRGNEMRKEQEARDRFEGWMHANPVEAAWLNEGAGRGFEFAQKLLEDVRKFGGLTEGQRNAITNSIAKREAAKVAREAAAPVVAGAGLETLTAAFAKAVAKGLKSPKVRIGVIVFSLAKAASANAGCLYVKHSDGTYLGKITPAGKLLKVRECTAENEATIIEIGRDPLAAAVAHGKRTGKCAICSRELTNAESVERGIGPICAENFGW